jgi:hypothetical protein
MTPLKKHHIKTYGGVEVYLLSFFTSVLSEGEWSALRPSMFTLRESLHYPLENRLVGIQSVSGHCM